MNSRFVLALVVIGAVLVLGWWALRGEEADEVGAAAAAAAISTDVAPVVAAADAGPEPARTTLRAVPFSERDADLPVEVLTEGRKLWVRDTASGAPVSHATVHVYDLGKLDHERLSAALLDRESMETALRLNPRRFRTNAEGFAFIPLLGTHCVVTAFTTSCWGFADFQAWRAEGCEVLVQRDVRVTIEVQTAAGKPAAGVLISVGQRDARTTPSLFAWRSDADGRVVIPSIATAWNACQRKPMVFFACNAPARKDDPVLDPANPVATDFVLTLPAQGSLRVKVSGTEALPESSRKTLRLQWQDTAVAGTGAHDWVAVPVIDGIAMLTHVSLGATCKLRFATPAAEVPAAEMVLLGPQADGACEDRELALPSLHPALSARLLSPDGSPIANGRISMRIQLPDHDLARTEWATDSAGRLLVALRTNHNKHSHAATIVIPAASSALWMLRTNPAVEADALCVRFALPRSIVPGVNDLGDITLLPPPLMAEGVVVDERGLPVPHAQVTAEGFRLGPKRNMERSGEPRSGFCDSEGRFRIADFCAAPEMSLRVNGEGLMELPETLVATGTTGVVLRIRRAARLRGQVLLSEGVVASKLQINIQFGRHGPGAGGAIIHQIPLREHGRFHIDHLEPGPWNLRVLEMDALRPPLAELPALELNADTDPAPPELNPLDLRGKVHMLTLTVRDEQGRPRNGAFVYAEGDVHERGHVANEQGVVTLVLRAVPINVVVRAHGYKDVELRGLSASREVVLEHGLGVRLRCPDAAQLPDAWHLSLTLEEHGFGRQWKYTPSSGRRNEPEFLLSAPGTYTVRARLVSTLSSRKVEPLELVVLTPGVSVANSNSLQTFVISLDQAALEAALRKPQKK